MQKHAGLTRDKAIEVEAKGFAKMAKTNVAACLVGLFLNDQTAFERLRAVSWVIGDYAALVSAYCSWLRHRPPSLNDITATYRRLYRAS